MAFTVNWLESFIRVNLLVEHGKCELPHYVTNDLRLRILVNEEIFGKSLNFTE